MPRVVIDANVALARLLSEPLADAVSGVLDEYELVAPSLWRLEVINTILVKERRRSVTRSDADRMIKLVDDFPIELVPDPLDGLAVDLAAFSRPHQLTTYDALYLELADGLRVPLFTLDRNIASAAGRVGVALIKLT